MGNLSESIASFFKVIIEDDYSRVLYLPPKFAHTVPHLLRKEIHLENLAGQRWSVVVSKENGYLAFRKGWSEFSVAHNLEIGDFLVFHYFSGQKFLVQIFNRSGCDVRGLGWDQGSPCRRRRRRRNDLNPVDTSPGKEDSNASLYSADVGNVCVHEGKSAAKVPPLAVGNNPMVKAEPANFEDPELQFLMVGRDMYNGQGEDRTVIDLSNYEMPSAGAKRTRHLTETGCSLLYVDNFVKCKPEPELTGVANHEQEKKPHFGFPESTKAKEIERSIYSDVKQKINNASTLGSPSLLDFSPLYGPYASKSKAPKKGYQAGKSDSPLQSGGSSVKIKKEIKT